MEAVEFAKKRNIPVFETSAKYKINMDNVFQKIVWEIANKGGVMEETASITSVTQRKCCVQ